MECFCGYLVLHNIERTKLNRLLSTQQNSPAGNIHSDSTSLNMAIAMKISAATAIPILAITNKIFNVLYIIKIPCFLILRLPLGEKLFYVKVDNYFVPFRLKVG